MLNNIQLMGNFTNTPKTTKSQSGLVVCNFTIANNGIGKDEHVNFVNCVAFRKTAEYIERNAQKGDTVIISGYLKTENYNDKEGNRRHGYSVVVNQAYIIKRNRNNSSATPNGTQTSYSQGPTEQTPTPTAAAPETNVSGGPVPTESSVPEDVVESFEQQGFTTASEDDDLPF